MQTIRTRLARLAAASAVVVSLGALAAGPAFAQTGIDIPSRPASGGGVIKTLQHFSTTDVTWGVSPDAALITF